MPKIEYKKDSMEIITENLTKNTDLYNKYTMLLSSIFISALTALGQHNGNYATSLKISILLFTISLSAALIELSFLIIHDSIILNTLDINFLKKIPLNMYLSGSNYLALIALAGFLAGMITVNIFIFTLQG